MCCMTGTVSTYLIGNLSLRRFVTHTAGGGHSAGSVSSGRVGRVHFRIRCSAFVG
jgi:hypothetical protein